MAENKNEGQRRLDGASPLERGVRQHSGEPHDLSVIHFVLRDQKVRPIYDFGIDEGQ